MTAIEPRYRVLDEHHQPVPAYVDDAAGQLVRVMEMPRADAERLVRRAKRLAGKVWTMEVAT